VTTLKADVIDISGTYSEPEPAQEAAGQTSPATDLRPLRDQVVIEMIKTPEKTEGGIILSERQQTTITWQGKVLAIGPGLPLPDGGHAEMSVAVGDLVHYEAYAGTEIPRGGRKLRILTEDKIYGVYSTEGQEG